VPSPNAVHPSFAGVDVAEAVIVATARSLIGRAARDSMTDIRLGQGNAALSRRHSRDWVATAAS
jgi:hypothetical protein